MWISFGLSIIVFLKEPLRGSFSFVQEESFNQPKTGFFQSLWSGAKIIFTDETLCWNLMGIFFLTWNFQTVTFYSLQYFNIFNMISLYSLLNAIFLVFGGIISNMMIGYLCQKFEKTNIKFRSYVLCTIAILAATLNFLEFFPQVSFAFSMTFVFLYVVSTSGYLSPSYSMMQ